MAGEVAQFVARALSRTRLPRADPSRRFGVLG